jgi:hypothetical protein
MSRTHPHTRKQPKSTPTKDRLGPCSFCRQSARRAKPDLYAPVYDVDCEHCGKYRIGGSGEAVLRTMANAGLSSWLRSVARANADGERLSIPGGMRIPLEY